MYDLVFIGGGPAGYVGAIRGAQLGAKVALIEADALGGTCLNRGCIPTKSFYRHAEVLKLVKEAEYFGIDATFNGLDMEKVQHRKNVIVDGLVGGISQLLKKNKVDVKKGKGRILDQHTVMCETLEGEEVRIEARDIVIATGSKPFVPPIKGIAHPRCMTTEAFLDIKEVPKELSIIGGGVIGIEFACIMNHFGAKVTVIEMEKGILPSVDDAISKRLKVMLKKQGITVLTGSKVNKIEDEEDHVVLHVEDKKGEKTVVADKVLVSTGRMPSIEGLELDNPGVTYSRKGIEVNDQYRTNLEHIYAVGDVNGENMLAHAASFQAIQVVEHLMEGKSVEKKAVPACIFSFPEIACVGVTEAEVKEQNISYQVGQFRFVANGKALTLGEGDGFVKVIADEMTKKIIGVHLLGPHSSDLIAEATLAVSKELSAYDFRDVIHAHPTLAEAFHEAVLDVIGEAIHNG